MVAFSTKPHICAHTILLCRLVRGCVIKPDTHHIDAMPWAITLLLNKHPLVGLCLVLTRVLAPRRWVPEVES